MPRYLISDAHEWINEIPSVPIYFPQGVGSSVLKHSRMQYGLSDPRVPKLVVYRKPVVMYHGSRGLALTG